jgi:transporter family protein
MNWFLLALIGPLLWAIVNHIDKYLLSNQFEGKSTGSLMIFSTLIAAVVLPVIYIVEPSIFGISTKNVLLLIVVGILSALAVWMYLVALDEDEVSIIVPLFQTIPLFGALFAFLFLGETLSLQQWLGCLTIIAGSMIITLEVDEEQKIRLKKKVLFFMLGSAAVFGFYETLFKVAAIDENFWVSSFWEHVGLLMVGIVLILIPKFRRDFLSLVTKNAKSIFSLNIGSEVMTIAGNIVTNYALMLAPVALVLAVSGTQPFLVLIMGVVLTSFFPKLGKEKLTKKHMLHKTVAIVIIFIGALMLH